MKAMPLIFSAVAAIAILVIGWQMGGREDARLAQAESVRARLLGEAGKLDGAPGDPAAANGNERATERRNAESIASRVARLRVLYRSIADGTKVAPELKMMALFKGLSDADAPTLRGFLLEAFEGPVPASENARAILAQGLMLYAEKSPEEGLGLFEKSVAFFKDIQEFQGMGECVLATALGEWGKRDPIKAVEWLKEHPEAYKGYLTENAKQGLVAAGATRDPRIAFQLMNEVSVGDRTRMISSIMKRTSEAGEGEVAVSALRSHLAGLSPEERREVLGSGIEGLAWGLSSLGCGKSTSTLKRIGLNQEQRDQFAAGLRPREGEEGMWLSWMGQSLSAAALDHEATKRVARWAEEDYRAAGQWLTALPEGDLRAISTQAYAEAAAGYDPETAAQWAETLPAGNSRSETLAAILRKWPAGVPGKAAFATKNGLQ